MRNQKQVLQALKEDKIRVDDLITGRIDLENIVDQGLDAL